MDLKIRVDGLEKVQDLLARLDRDGLRNATAKALTDGGFQARKVLQQELVDVFDRVTPYISKSVYVKPATTERLVAEVLPTYYGGKGIDPQKILQAQEFGGRRRDKRSEVALRRIGILPTGYQTAIPAKPYPGSDDGRGNVKGSFLVQLMSYFAAFGEQGYRANMTARRKRTINRGTAKQAGRRYCVSYGSLRSGKTSHLAPGIWAASGTDGVIVQPVLMFIRSPGYRPRLSMERVARKADVITYIERRLRYRIRQAMGV